MSYAIWDDAESRGLVVVERITNDHNNGQLAVVIRMPDGSDRHCRQSVQLDDCQVEIAAMALGVVEPPLPQWTRRGSVDERIAALAREASPHV